MSLICYCNALIFHHCKAVKYWDSASWCCHRTWDDDSLRGANS